MKSKSFYVNLIFACTLIVNFSCNYQKSKESVNTKHETSFDKHEKQSITDSNNHGYNELANTDNRQTFTISDYNTDNSEIENINRPKSSTIKTNLDTDLLFNIWTVDPEGPHADFVLSKNCFHVIDYDGNGDMPYELIGNNLKIYYNDFIQEGKILSVSKDTLKVKWRDFDAVNEYVKWIIYSE